MTKDEKKAYDAARHLAKRDERNAQNRAWREAHPAEYRAAIETWRRKNRVRVAAKVKEYADKNPGRLRDARLARYQTNPEVFKAAQRRYISKNPGARAMIRMNRDYAHKHYLDVRIPVRLLRIQRCECAECGKSLRRGFHIDHVVPLSRGGQHREGNLQLLCKSCNLSKGSKLTIEWHRWKRKVLSSTCTESYAAQSTR